MKTAKHVDPMAGVELMLTVKQVGAVLQKDEWAVRDLIHSGDLSAHNVGKGERSIWRIKPSDLNRYLDSRKSAAA